MSRNIVWDWTCVDGADEPAPATTAWACRNKDVEVACDEGGCGVSDAHTPMDVTVDQAQMTVCAYSGCWSGAPAAMTLSSSFLTVTVVGLPFSTNPDNTGDVSITIETRSRVANILVVGHFANPATCQIR